MFDFTELNFLAILGGIVTNMILGMLWYSPIMFGNIWLNLVDKKAEDISDEDGKKSMSFSIIPAILMIFTLAIALQVAEVETILGGLLYASLIVIGFVGTNMFNLVLFEGRGIKLTLINLGYAFVSLNIAAVILTIVK